MYASVAVITVPVLFAAAIVLLRRQEEIGWADYMPLAVGVLSYLVFLGETTNLCPCGVRGAPTDIGHGALLQSMDYDLTHCLSIAAFALAVSFGGLLLPPYNRKKICSRLAAAAPAFFSYIALGWMSLLVNYHD